MDEYISRRAFIEAKEKQYCQNCDRRKNSKGKVVYSIGDAPCRACGIGDMLDDVEDFPAADVRPVKKGHWIRHISDLFPAESTIECDQCHAEQPSWIDDNFCPNCGAHMGDDSDAIAKD